ncbi:ferritin-like domain-containing protein [Nonomuraea sp. B12E4]|uniref:ferritin-like domain-containing protein n=1 Tax=Nonomuraea sp. B12E4 TaxID=3153564 RepID=UPI00325E613D
MPDQDSGVPLGKIYPRNLTARADHVVRGNPAGSRPESGVDNCYPGLEFDQRNLDKAFFPGLVVEFHRPDGARIVALTGGGPAPAQGLTAADLPLDIWAVCGRTTVDQGEEAAPTIGCDDRNGLEVWRAVHDLLPGTVALLIGPGPGITSPGSDPVRGDLNGFRRRGTSILQRAPDGSVQVGVLVADRARYLDDDGVIEPEAYEPGELTRSLCAPWQYDFRDCGCFYWAASKPDIVTSADGLHADLNFQRRDRVSDPPPKDGPRLAGRRELELDYHELIADWGVLPVVLNDREGESRPAPAHPGVEPLTPEQVADELAYLATVEHALCVQYLFAHYSLDAPMRLPAGADSRTRRVYAAAQEIFGIAIDEMRHLRWANEALGVLGRAPVLGRAETIHRQLRTPFSLQPLTPRQLDWFIEVERPSQASGGGIDGMYVRLHAALTGDPDAFPEADRLAHLIKLIIDEGADHFRRFTAVKTHLAGLSEAEYLRRLDHKPAPGLDTSLLDLADQNYALLLDALRATFALGDAAGGLLIEQSRRAMFNLHETHHALSARGVAPRFTLPLDPVLEAGDSGTELRRRVAELGGPEQREAMLRQEADAQTLIAALQDRAGG